ncbi:MAG: acetylornithine transaminase [Planctomycetes bacterium]|nr:acetylornithine transaminase [Planctomycetota bacterium]
MTTHLLNTYAQAPEVFVGGDGAELRTKDGRTYLDFLAGIAVSALGHNHPRLVRELQDQLTRAIHLSNLYRHPFAEDVATRIARLTGMEAVFFTNSGTEANECAIKIARKVAYKKGERQRTGLVALEGSFHGRSMGSVSLTHTEKYRKPFAPLLPGVEFVAPGDVARLEALLSTRTFQALFVEPIQGEQGVKELPHDFLRAARKLCTETGTLLVHDEVQCGSGRTGTFLAADAAGVKPDVATLAKPIAAGLPMGCTVVAKELADVFEPGDHGSTFAGGPFVCRGALVFLELMEEGGLQEAVRARGSELRAGLADLKGEFTVITELRGRGLMQGVRLARGAEDLQKQLYAKGLITNRTAGDVLRLLPPYVVTSEQIARGVSILREALAEL